MNNQPAEIRLAEFPPDYGTRGGADDTPMAWSDVERQIADAPNYWITTVTTDGRPHARPIDGVWVLGALCFGGSPSTRWVRNLQANSVVSVHLPSGDDVVILEGTVELIADPDHPLAAASTDANRAKYPQYFGGDDPPPFRPFWALRPTVVYAWTLAGFPNRATCCTFRH